MIDPVMQSVISAYRRADVNAVFSDPQNARVVQLWLDNHSEQVSHSPMLNNLRNRVFAPSDVESKLLSGKFTYFKSHPVELVKNIKLIQTHLELKTLTLQTGGLLPLLLDKLSTKDLAAVLRSNAVSIEGLTKLQILRLSRFVYGSPHLPPYAQKFNEILQQPNTDQGIQNIKGIVGLTNKEKDAAIAHYIEHRNISLKDVKLNSEELLRLAPHLRYVELQNFPDIPLAKELLQKCSNLNVLYINQDNILEGVSSLPFCRQFFCTNGTNLQALPALPLCKELNCNWCTKLQALPSLPLCEMLVCIGCTGLQALPALPLCKTIECSECTSLQALPALPFCERLECTRCTSLQALPSLPLCENLFFSGCTNLTSLPLSLGQNPRLNYLEIQGTRIDRAVRDAIHYQCRGMRDAEAVKILPLRLAKWKAMANSRAELDISVLSYEQIRTLNEWLGRLERTEDFTRSRSLLAITVCTILADLFKNKEFQELFFPQAEANNAFCGDRAAMSLNEIYTSWKIICTPETLPLRVMTGIAKTLRLRKELQKLIKGDELESVEIFLYYESTLRERLNLETAIQNMIYSPIGERDRINVDKLVEDVEANFVEELIELPVFEKMMKQKWEGINEKFSTQLEEIECPLGDPNDPQVLNYQNRQGEIMQEWKREKMRVAKRVVCNL